MILVTINESEALPPDPEHLIVRRDAAGTYGLFGVMDGDPSEFAVTGEAYGSEARAVDAAKSFAESRQVGLIYVVRGK